MGHLFSFLKLTPLKDETYFPYTQSLAVLVFFLLSGLLTDYSLQRKPESYSYEQYIKDHVIRIYGSYFPALLFIAVLDGWSMYLSPDTYPYYASYNLKNFGRNIIMLPAVFEPFGTGRPLWTLYLEWWAYIAFGYIMLVCRRKYAEGRLKQIHLCILALMLYIPFRCANLIPLLAFLLGIVINRIYRRVEINGITSIIVTVMVFLAWSAYVKDAYHITETVLIAIIMVQVLAYGNKFESKLSRNTRKRLQFLSGCTYPLYLTHYSLIEFFLYRSVYLSPWSIFWICFVFSNVFAVIFYIAVKKVTDMIRR